MSDPLAMLGKGSPGMGMGGSNPTMQTIEENRSMFNPTDLASMKTNGEITPDMTIRQFFESQGLDVEGPVTQLVEWQMSQIQKADPLNKMKAIAGKGGGNMQSGGMPPSPAGGLPQGNKPQGGGGIAELMAATGGGA
jgi:hypothetical protein